MKTMSKILLSFLLIQISVVAFSSDDIGKDTLNLPKKALILSISSFESEIIYTMIDLSNDEMVIVCYSTDYVSSIKTLGLKKVVRTGIILDTVEQKKLILNSQTYQSIKN